MLQSLVLHHHIQYYDLSLKKLCLSVSYDDSTNFVMMKSHVLHHHIRSINKMIFLYNLSVTQVQIRGRSCWVMLNISSI